MAVRRILLIVLILAIPVAFVSGLWSAPDATYWWREWKESRRPVAPPPVKDEDLKCLAPDACVGSRVPQAFAHMPHSLGSFSELACFPYPKAGFVTAGEALAGKSCPTPDYFVTFDAGPAHTMIVVRGGRIESIHRGPPPMTL